MSVKHSVSELHTRLPPRPDLFTGRPFPPHAPAYGDDAKPEDDPFRETRLSHRPDSPPGRSPTLAWYQDNRWYRFYGLAFSLLFMSGAGTIVFLWNDLPAFGWLQPRFWFLWVIVVITALLMSKPWRNEYMSAGADWVSFGTTFPTRWRNGPGVKVYELTKIRTSVAVGRRYLDITDSDNVTIERPLAHFENDARIWALVYNGILHSVANGADIRLGDAKTLSIGPDSPAMLLNQHYRGIKPLPGTPSEPEPHEPDRARPLVYLPTHDAAQPTGELLRRSGALRGSPFQHGGSVWLQRQDTSTIPVIWPRGFAARFDPLELLNPDGTVIAREDDKVLVTGTLRTETDGTTIEHGTPGLDHAFIVHSVEAL